MTTERDIRNQIAYAKKEGIALGFAEGKAEGEAKGKAEGERLKSLAIAKAMKENGIALEVIATCTQLSQEDIAIL